jgi:hypothetical protein
MGLSAPGQADARAFQQDVRAPALLATNTPGFRAPSKVGPGVMPFGQVQVPGGQQPIRVGPGFVPTGPIPDQPPTRNPILTAISQAPSPSFIMNMPGPEDLVDRPTAGGASGGGGGGAPPPPAPPLPPLPVPEIPDVKMAPLPAQAPLPPIPRSEIPLLSALLFRKQALMQ